jgi:hypothetical protein
MNNSVFRDFLNSYQYGKNVKLVDDIKVKNPSSYDELNKTIIELFEDYFEIKIVLNISREEEFRIEDIEKYINEILNMRMVDNKNELLIKKEDILKIKNKNYNNKNYIFDEIYFPHDDETFNMVLSNYYCRYFSVKNKIKLDFNNSKFKTYCETYGSIIDNIFFPSFYVKHKIPYTNKMTIELFDEDENKYLSEEVEFSCHSDKYRNIMAINKDLPVIIPLNKKKLVIKFIKNDKSYSFNYDLASNKTDNTWYTNLNTSVYYMNRNLKNYINRIEMFEFKKESKQFIEFLDCPFFETRDINRDLFFKKNKIKSFSS